MGMGVCVSFVRQGVAARGGSSLLPPPLPGGEQGASRDRCRYSADLPPGCAPTRLPRRIQP
eukprot:7757643-Pyramimonas_sp.AAC.1